MRLSPRALQTAALVSCDLLGINAGFVGSYVLLYESQIAGTWQAPALATALKFLLLLNAACGVIFSAYRLYAIRRAGSRVDEAYKVFVAMTIATMGASVIATMIGLHFTTWNLVAAWLLAVFLVILLRNIARSLIYHARTRGFDSARAVIVGTGATGQMIAGVIGRAPHLGYDLQGFVSDDAPVGSKVADLPVLGHLDDIRRVVRACHVNEILVTLPGAPSQEILQLVAACENEAVAIKIYPDTFQIITNNEITLGDLDGLPLLSIKRSPLDLQFNRGLKRGLDFLGAAVGLILLSPLMLLIAGMVRLDSPGSVIFVQERVGFNGQPFKMFKFRSMHVGAEAAGPGWTRPDDDRRTPLGTFIRRYSLDELPQLINVLLGEMSLVGPRPEQPYFVEQFRHKIPRYMGRHKEKAGLTGWAQVNGLRGDTSVEERTRYDLYYVENWSLLFDIKIIARTLATIFRRGSNAY